MTYLEWDDRYCVGIEELDVQHKQLIAIVNDLSDAVEGKKTPVIILTIVSRLLACVKVHFAAEERFFSKYNYPDMYNHRRDHNIFTRQVSEFKEGFESGKILEPDAGANYIKEWMIQHISISDRKYGPFLSAMGAK